MIDTKTEIRKLLTQIDDLVAGLNGYSSTPSPLSKRELEIADLVCKGKTNKQIADELFIAEVTVKVHVRNIFGKIHASNRTQVAMIMQNNKTV